MSSSQVTQLISKLPSLQKEVQYLRELILGIDKDITDIVKWNSPSFYYKGEMKEFDPKEYKRDIAVMHLRKGNIMLVLPTGAVIKKATSILEGDYKDGRRMITFNSMEDIQQKEKELKKVIREWLELVEK